MHTVRVESDRKEAYRYLLFLVSCDLPLLVRYPNAWKHYNPNNGTGYSVKSIQHPLKGYFMSGRGDAGR